MSREEQLRFLVRSVGGEQVLAPSDGITAGRLRERGYRVGDIVMATIRKPRHPGHHRKAHALGRFCADNLDAFHGLDAHAVLKRLQIESGIGCETYLVRSAWLWRQVAGVIERVMGRAFAEVLRQTVLALHEIPDLEVTVPRSLSFASMDEGEFTEVYRGLCRQVAEHYQGECTEQQIEELVALYEREAA